MICTIEKNRREHGIYTCYVWTQRGVHISANSQTKTGNPWPELRLDGLRRGLHLLTPFPYRPASVKLGQIIYHAGIGRVEARRFFYAWSRLYANNIAELQTHCRPVCQREGPRLHVTFCPGISLTQRRLSQPMPPCGCMLDFETLVSTIKQYHVRFILHFLKTKNDQKWDRPYTVLLIVMGINYKMSRIRFFVFDLSYPIIMSIGRWSLYTTQKKLRVKGNFWSFL